MKWNDLREKGIKSIGGAVSGGLDSCTVTHWLNDKGFSVTCYTVDLAQPDETELTDIKKRMMGCKAVDAVLVSGTEALAEAGLKVVQAQARYEGGYWNTTAIARPVTVESILPHLKKEGIPVLFHGCTGRGNDQVRFQLASNMIEPEVEIYAPWRDADFIKQFPGRKEMIEYCNENDLPLKASSEARYSTDANFLGLTHEAGDLEDVSIRPFFVEPIMGVWPWDAPDVSEFVTIKWDKGIPIEINGMKVGLVEAFTQSNEIAGRHGIGIGTHVIENRFVGIKSRGIYESPGIELIGKAYEYLLQFILDRRARNLFESLSRYLSEQIYQGFWFDLGSISAMKAINNISQHVTGSVTLKLHKGSILFSEVEDQSTSIPYSLYTDDSSMENLGDYDHADAEGFLKILGVSAKNYGKKHPRN